MRILFSISLFFFTFFTIAAAPLESGYTLAPRSSASVEERAAIYIELRNRVINAAVRYEGVPYSYGGVTYRGLDCSGFIYLSFKDAVNVNLPRSASGIYSWAEIIPLDQAQPGDLLFFRTGSNNSITHVALYLGGRRFIHSASEGPHTGVIYSTLDESYWSRCYAAAGRAFPGAPSGTYPENTSMAANRQSAPKSKNNFHISAAFAPSWNGNFKDNNFFRGFTSHLGIGTSGYFLNTRMTFGLEVRPEYDKTLGVFRLPVTLSWGLNENVSIFGGPVLSFGEPSISTENGVREYSGGTSWFGSLGVTITPFTISTAAGNFSPYVEAAWQNYYSKDAVINLDADFNAYFRLSTGVRYVLTF